MSQSQKFETDMSDTGAQSGSVSGSALVMLSMGLSHSSKKQYKQLFLILKLWGQYYNGSTRNIHFGIDALEAWMGPFYTYRSEKILRIVKNSHEFLFIHDSCLHSAYSYV